MAESNSGKRAEPASSAPLSSPDALVKDLDVEPSVDEQKSVKGGKVSMEYRPQPG
jgi:hypothetical protein